MFLNFFYYFISNVIVFIRVYYLLILSIVLPLIFIFIYILYYDLPQASLIPFESISPIDEYNFNTDKKVLTIIDFKDNMTEKPIIKEVPNKAITYTLLGGGLITIIILVFRNQIPFDSLIGLITSLVSSTPLDSVPPAAEAAEPFLDLTTPSPPVSPKSNESHLGSASIDSLSSSFLEQRWCQHMDVIFEEKARLNRAGLSTNDQVLYCNKCNCVFNNLRTN